MGETEERKGVVVSKGVFGLDKEEEGRREEVTSFFSLSDGCGGRRAIAAFDD